MNDYYMLQQLDEYITGNYGEDYFAEEPDEKEGENEEDGRRTFGI